MGKVLLVILDGWGYKDDQNYNAIKNATTPNYNRLISECPNSLLEASGLAVGLPQGQMGNSEVGHITIGAGRPIFQDLPRINQAIANGDIKKNPAILGLIAKLKDTGNTCHLIGLISDGGVHCHILHIINIAKFLSESGVKVKLHAITDGRDVAPKSVKKYLGMVAEANIEIATISGRFYAMDRDKRWDRVKLAYNAIVKADAPKFQNPELLVEESYNEGITDEFIVPHSAQSYNGIKPQDAVLFANYRADRIRQLSASITDPAFTGFECEKPELAAGLMVSSYSDDLAKVMEVIFPHQIPAQTLGEVVAANHIRQLRVAETEKYAHVTYFFNGGREQPFELEDRVLVPSPKVATYDLMPEMSSSQIADIVVSNIKKNIYGFICVNFANCDMVGHSGSMEATIKAVNSIDVALGKIIQALEGSGYDMLVTADHGNAEEMIDHINMQPLTSHTLNPVPFIYYGKTQTTLKNGTLADVAPTVLKLLGLEKPSVMEGGSLL